MQHRAWVVIAGLVMGCTHREVIRPGQVPPIVHDGKTYLLATRSSPPFEVEVIGAHPTGDLVVLDDGQIRVIPRSDIGSLSRVRRGRGWVHGFGWTVAASAVAGLLAATTYDEDDCDFACGGGNRFAAVFSIGALLGLTWGGAIGAIKGAPVLYVYE